MPVDVGWADAAQTAVSITFSGGWTIEDFHLGVRETLVLYDSVTYDVHLIIDVSDNQRLPPGLLSALRRARSAERTNQGMTIVVGVTPLIRSFLDMLYSLNMFKWQAVLADDLDAALELVQESMVQADR